MLASYTAIRKLTGGCIFLYFTATQLNPKSAFYVCMRACLRVWTIKTI